MTNCFMNYGKQWKLTMEKLEKEKKNMYLYTFLFNVLFSTGLISTFKIN